MMKYVFCFFAMFSSNISEGMTKKNCAFFSLTWTIVVMPADARGRLLIQNKWPILPRYHTLVES